MLTVNFIILYLCLSFILIAKSTIIKQIKKIVKRKWKQIRIKPKIDLKIKWKCHERHQTENEHENQTENYENVIDRYTVHKTLKIIVYDS